MSRIPIVMGNWKLHHTQAGTRSFCSGLRDLAAEGKLPAPEQAILAIAPPYTSVATLVEELAGLPVRVGGQNLHWESSGAFTGEVSGEMLAEAGCRFVIIGHSERRHVFGETDARIGRKVAAAREAGLLPVLCVGETEDERDSGRTEVVVQDQLRRGLEHWMPKAEGDLVLAYEPVWAIGTGRTATPAQAQEVQRFLREILAGAAGHEVAAGTHILYGGSVKPNNAADLSQMADVDGFLIGGASLEPGSLLAIAGAACG